MNLASGTVRLAPADPRWPACYRAHAERIRAALGPEALRIEHVGSTAVPGLVAKPVIDIVLVVDDSAAEPSYLPALEQAGYRLRIREPQWFEHRMLGDAHGGVNLHVFSDGCPEIEAMMRFRDRLRSRADERERYEALKRRLAGRRWDHVQQYADAKTDLIREILARGAITT